MQAKHSFSDPCVQETPLAIRTDAQHPERGLSVERGSPQRAAAQVPWNREVQFQGRTHCHHQALLLQTGPGRLLRDRRFQQVQSDQPVSHSVSMSIGCHHF